MSRLRLRLFVEFDFAVSTVGRAKKQPVFATLKPSDNALAVHKGKNNLTGGVIAKLLDDEQVLVVDVLSCWPRPRRPWLPAGAFLIELIGLIIFRLVNVY